MVGGGSASMSTRCCSHPPPILIGFKGVAFAFCARVYALNEGLLPEDRTLERMFRHFTLETGLAVGAILLRLGLMGGLFAVAGWSRAGFGTLDPRETLRTAIPAATALCLGGEVMFTSFLLSFLGLRRQRLPDPSDALAAARYPGQHPAMDQSTQT